jgi:hypothetical protein
VKGAVPKAFFPSVWNKPRQKIPIFPKFTTMATGHGRLSSYLHRFGLIDNPKGPVKKKKKKKNKLQIT